MPEAALLPDLAGIQQLQRALVHLALSPKGSASIISEPHRSAFDRSLPKQQTYRDLVRSSLWDPVEAVFPISAALLGDAFWADCQEAFLSAGAVQSRHYRDVPASFVGWLAESRWGEDQWPSLLQLAHLELVEVLVSFAPDPPVSLPLSTHPALELRVRLHPSAHLLNYTCAVHHATLDHPQSLSAPTHLLAFRDADDHYRLMELTPATSALLSRAQGEALGAAMAALSITDSSAVFHHLTDLHHHGAILGFQS